MHKKAHPEHYLKRTVKNSIISISQILFYLFSFIFIRGVVRAKRTLPKNIHTLKSGSLLVANHQSKMDPFIVLAHLPFSTFIQIVPVRFPVHHNFMKLRRYYYPLSLLGAYDIGGTPWAKMIGLLRTKKYLDDGTTVFIFPEGKINQAAVGEFKQGIEMFIKDGRQIIIVRINGLERSLSALFKSGNSIRFGTVFDTHYQKLDAATLRSFLDIL